MILDAIECQKIVDRLMSILGKNVNMMDPEGVILASGDKNRINSFHQAAKIAAQEKREVSVTGKELELYEGAKPGVNLPIYYNNEVQGVLGITGPPLEVKDYGIIVKELVELMIQENERKKFELFQLRAIKTFAREIIKDSFYEDENILKTRAQLIGFDESIPRIVLVGDICGFSLLTERFESNTETMIQKLKQDILDNISSISNKKYDIVFNLSEDRFVIFKSLNTDVKQFCIEIEKIFKKKLNISLHIGTGGICRVLKDYHAAYMLANKVVNIGKKINPEKLIYLEEDYRIQLLLSSINQDGKEIYLNSLGKIFLNKEDKASMEMLNTIKVYFEKGMNIKATSESMYLHRNTISYRLNRFKELYELDVTAPYSCMLVYIAIILLELA